MIRVRTIAPLTFALLLSSPALAQATGFQREVLAMGTRLSMRIESPSQEQSAVASEAAFAECNRIESATSTWKADSAFTRLNQVGGQAFSLNREWLDLLRLAKGWSRRTGGAFDPVLARLLAAHGVREGGHLPSSAELAGARAASGAKHLFLNFRDMAVRLENGAGIEEGGFVKGYALDRMEERLRQAGISSGLLDFGGQLLAFGPAVEVSIADPKDRNYPRFSLALKDASLASSGLSEHGHHIVDPRSGLLCEDWGSVSVIAASAFDADCLSTALYVMGPDEGLAWAKRHAVAALFLLNHGQVRMSPVFKALNPQLSSTEKS